MFLPTSSDRWATLAFFPSSATPRRATTRANEETWRFRWCAFDIGARDASFLTCVLLEAKCRLLGGMGRSLARPMAPTGLAGFPKFMRDHRQHLKTGQETGNYVPGVCHYYSLMSDVITLTSGPFWHFVPMYAGVSRMDCHHRFHDVMAKYLDAKPTDRILEVGCGFGEAGRQVALRSGAKVTG
ncbi:unnamed protein product, partial [Prorocentrum cordatum]